MASSSQGAEASETPQESHRLSTQSLVHACQCRDANCSLPSCQKMKRVVQHTKGCMRRTYGGCPVCKQLVALCCYHAKHCQENKCPVPFCLNIKHKLRQPQLQHRLQQAQMMRWGMAALSPQQREVPPQGPQAATPMESPPMPQQPPGLPGVATATLQDLLHELRSPSSPQQQQEVLRILRSNPKLKVQPAFIKWRAAKSQASQLQHRLQLAQLMHQRMATMQRQRRNLKQG